MYDNIGPQNSDDIPTITNYCYLFQVIFVYNKEKNSRLDLFEKIHSLYHGLGHEEDLEIIALRWYKLLAKHVKCWIVSMKDEKKSITGVRNSFAHGNYYSLSNSNVVYLPLLGKLQEGLTPEQRKKFEQNYQKEKGDWILWNSYENSIKFICIISNKGLNKAITKFQKECCKIIVRSNKIELENDPAKKINKDALVRFIKDVEAAGKWK